MLINVIAMLIGALILVGGIYYFLKEKGDRESRKIYGTTTGIGACLLYTSSDGDEYGRR